MHMHKNRRPRSAVPATRVRRETRIICWGGAFRVDEKREVRAQAPALTITPRLPSFLPVDLLLRAEDRVNGRWEKEREEDASDNRGVDLPRLEIKAFRDRPNNCFLDSFHAGAVSISAASSSSHPLRQRAAVCDPGRTVGSSALGERSVEKRHVSLLRPLVSKKKEEEFGNREGRIGSSSNGIDAMSKGAKLERYNSYLHRINTTKLIAASSKLLFCASLLIALLLALFISLSLTTTASSPTDALHHHRLLPHQQPPSPPAPPP
ncbi:hypothetical protein EJ110_NYTH40115 [Nymphaea thermarum]|nr:hypothetical protein EJ110_NYTH40115 [Nymphaea thermarum]